MEKQQHYILNETLLHQPVLFHTVMSVHVLFFDTVMIVHFFSLFFPNYKILPLVWYFTFESSVTFDEKGYRYFIVKTVFFCCFFAGTEYCIKKLPAVESFPEEKGNDNVLSYIG